MTDDQAISRLVDRKMKALLAALGVLVLLGIAAAVGSSRPASSSAPADPPRFSSMSLLLSSDAAKVSADLAIAANDAKQGQSGAGQPACYNLQNNVTPDVDAIGRFVSGDFVNDVNKLQTDINTLEANIRNFNQDIADFVNDGVIASADGTQIIKEIRGHIASEVKSANNTISAVRTYVNEAYTDANNLTSGACSRDGPGKEPTIPTVIS
jgi:hypothetical protein